MQKRKWLICLFILAITTQLQAQRITFDLLKGSWQAAKESRDIKIYGEDYKLSFNSYDARCYLKSVWSFDSDSTGHIDIPSGSICTQAVTIPFTYQLQEAPGYGGPVYRLPIFFQNGVKDVLYIGWDGKQTLKIGYNQVLEGSPATDNRVSIVYAFKKKK